MPRATVLSPAWENHRFGCALPALFRPGLRRREPLRLNVLYRGNG